MIRTKKARSALAATLVLGLLTTALLVAACGGSTATSPSPSPTPSSSSVMQKLAALKAYVAQVTPIDNTPSSALSTLDGTVSSLSKKPDKTWTKSAAQMTMASAALGTAATELAALTPPASLQSTQDTVVSALQAAQKALDKSGAYLSKRAYDPSYPDIKTQIKQQVTDSLAAAWTGIVSSAGRGTPTPMATP
jgi:hypothetical protein